MAGVAVGRSVSRTYSINFTAAAAAAAAQCTPAAYQLQTYHSIAKLAIVILISSITVVRSASVS